MDTSILDKYFLPVLVVISLVALLIAGIYLRGSLFRFSGYRDMYENRTVDNVLLDKYRNAGLYGFIGFNMRPKMYLFMPVYSKYIKDLSGATSIQAIETVLSNLAQVVKTTPASSYDLSSSTPMEVNMLYRGISNQNSVMSFIRSVMTPMMDLVPTPIKTDFYNALLSEERSNGGLENMSFDRAFILLATEHSLNKYRPNYTKFSRLISYSLTRLRYALQKDDRDRKRDVGYEGRPLPELPFDSNLDTVINTQYTDDSPYAYFTQRGHSQRTGEALANPRKIIAYQASKVSQEYTDINSRRQAAHDAERRRNASR